VTTATFQLAQVNIGRARGDMTDPVMAGFVSRLAEINALADASPGFVWRLQTEDGDATAVRPYADVRILINLSVWTDLAALRAYVYRSPHASVMRGRRDWFERFDLVGAGGPSADRGGGSGAAGLPGAAWANRAQFHLCGALRARRTSSAPRGRAPERCVSRHLTRECSRQTRAGRVPPASKASAATMDPRLSQVVCS
jgi:Domain of unknown function (DUF3291)